MTTDLRAAIVDDHALLTAGLVSWLQVNAPNVSVLYAGPDVASALGHAEDLDVVLLDIGLQPDQPPVGESVFRFTEADVPVLLVSQEGDPVRIRSALRSGAVAYLHKSSGMEELLDAMRRIVAGESVITPEMAAAMAEQRADTPDLSDQELRALQLYAGGLKLNSVARRMGIAPSTAKEYIVRVRRKYHKAGRTAGTKTDLHNEATRDGFITPDGPEGTSDDERDDKPEDDSPSTSA